MKVLVAVDDSKFSEAAVDTVVAQFNPKGTELRLTHVVEPITITAPPEMAKGYAPELLDQVKKAEGLVERFAKKLRAAGFQVETEVREGDVREEIIDAAAEWDANMIVLGSRGLSGIKRLLLGSVAEFVARNADCSVEIARRRAA
jgi:nucleotide-binding universal stress UspA family protein